MSEPVRWIDSPAEAPHGAAELLRAVEPPPPMDHVTRAEVWRAVSRTGREGTVVAQVARSPYWGWVGAAAAVVLSVVVTATVARSCGEPASVAGPSTGPATSMQPVDEEVAAPVDPAPDVAPEDPPREPEEPEVALPEPEVTGDPDRSPDRERVAARPPPARATPRTTQGEGYLVINTNPWSRVFLDGRDIGITPILRHRVSAGRHTLVFHPRDDPARATRRTVVVEPDQMHRVVLRL